MYLVLFLVCLVSFSNTGWVCGQVSHYYQMLSSLFPLPLVLFLTFSTVLRVVNGSVPVRVHGGPETGIVKEKVEPDLDPEPFRNQFLGSGTGTGTIYRTGLDPGSDLGRE